MTRSTAIVGSAVLAGFVGLAIFLRPKPAAHDELPAPANIPPALVQVLKTKMVRHEAQMRSLISHVVLLDDDGVARAAGEIFDEPSLARPLGGDELNGALPERFFALQDDLRQAARRMVLASQKHDRAAMADELAAVSRTCVSCHEVYLRGAAATAPAR